MKMMMPNSAPGGSPRQSIADSILKFQGKLNASRSLCSVKGAEATGKHSGAAWRASWNEGTAAQISVAYSEDVPVKDVEKRCPEVDCGPLTEEPGFLAEREVFVLGCEPPSRGKGSGLVAKLQRTCS